MLLSCRCCLQPRVLLRAPHRGLAATWITPIFKKRLPVLRSFSAALLSSPSVASTLATSHRWCCSDAGKLETPGASLSAPQSNAAGTPAKEADATTHESASSRLASIADQLKNLSPEDQHRIIAALQSPEKEKSSVMGGAGIGPATGDMVAAFTCGPCNFRMVKRFSKHAYTKGIVIVECPNCRAKHLLADNLGWMEDTYANIEEMLKAKGESFVRIGGSEEDYQVMMADSSSAAVPQT